MKLIRRLVIFIMILVFIFGLGVLLYPYVKGHLVDSKIQHDAEEFLSWVEIAPFVPDSFGSHVVVQDPAGPAIPEPTEPDQYVDLWYAMMNYNRGIYLKGQEEGTEPEEVPTEEAVPSESADPTEVTGEADAEPTETLPADTDEGTAVDVLYPDYQSD